MLLGAAGDRDVAVAEQDVLHRRDDRLQPEPQRRLTVRHGVPTGRPASTAATRDRYMSLASPWITLPITTWPTLAGSTFARATASLMATAPRRVAARSQRAAVIADRRARSRNHHYLAVAHCSLPCKSCSPARSIRTVANSPTSARPLKRTTPSISGASALERPRPRLVDENFQGPAYFRLQAGALIAACTCISRPRRSFLYTSSGTASGRALAAAPSTGE